MTSDDAMTITVGSNETMLADRLKTEGHKPRDSF